MKQDTKQEYSLEKSIKILAEMTKKDIQRLCDLEDFSDIKVIHPCQKIPVPHLV